VDTGGPIGRRYWPGGRLRQGFTRVLDFSHTRRIESGGWGRRCGNHDDQTRFETRSLSGSFGKTDVNTGRDNCMAVKDFRLAVIPLNKAHIYMTIM
jgi:hypothetical protein